jgi:hypothetical protein
MTALRPHCGMVNFLETASFAAPLVIGVGASFLLLLTVLSCATLAGNGWGLRRTALAALAASQGLVALAASRRQAWRSIAAEKAVRVAALRNQPALVQRNLRVKTAGMVRREGAALPVSRVARPAFDLGHDRRFAGRLEDLAGLYVSPPEHALVWCCEEGRPLRAVTRNAQGLAVRPAPPAHRHDLLGSTPLSEALGDLSGSVIGSCALDQRHVQWLKFLRQVEHQTAPGRQLLILCDSHATQQHPSVRKWLAAHPRVQIEFTSSEGAGLKMIKRFFDHVIAEQLGVRAFHSVAELSEAIARHVKIPIGESAPFTWIRSAPAPDQRLLRTAFLRA